MPSPNEITVQQLARLIGTPQAPNIVDLRIDDDFRADPRFIPGAIRRNYKDVLQWGPALRGKPTVVACHKGQKISQGVTAWLRHEGVDAQSLEGGMVAWAAADQMVLVDEKVPRRDGHGRTIWVTRARPKIDRIACPWLIRRFVDPTAVFLFVAPAEVAAVADRFDATPFDIDRVFWSHRGDTCTFDTMLTEFALHSPALQRLGLIVRGADTARPDLEPQCGGLVAVALGLSRMYKDDLAQLDASMVVYDALYRWCRDAVDETHNWPAATAKS